MDRQFLRVVRAGPGVTIQDGGRFGYLRYGVTPAGPMDWTAFRTANLAIDNDDRAAAIEVSLGGLEVLCEGAPLAVAFAGGAFLWRRGGLPMPSAARILLRPGERLLAQAGERGAFAYLAAAGGFDTPIVMASRTAQNSNRQSRRRGLPLPRSLFAFCLGRRTIISRKRLLRVFSRKISR